MSALLLFNAALDLLLVIMLFRADWRRRENQLLALVGFLDAARDALVALLLLDGHELTGLPTQLCVIGRILVVYPLLEFSYAFPTGRRPTNRVRVVGLTATVLAVACTLHPATAAVAFGPLARLAFFAPFLVATVIVSRQNLATLRALGSGGEERTVLFALLFRYVEAVLAGVVIPALFPDLLRAALTFDAVIAVLTSVVIAHAVLRYRLFRAAGLISEALLYGALALACAATVAKASEFVSAQIADPILRSGCFVCVGLLPLATWMLVSSNAPRIANAFLCPFDARRRALRDETDHALQASFGLTDAVAVCELTTRAIERLSSGPVVLWSTGEPGAARVKPADSMDGPVLPGALVEHLRHSVTATLHRRSLSDPALAQLFRELGADALVAVRSQGALLCAFAIKSRVLDHDLLRAARTLADNLGSALAHQALHQRASDLQSQLEASRRLTTLGSFVAAIAHDIRTPLTSVKMNIEMVREYQELRPDMRECTDMALEELHRMNDYVSGMLDYVKPIQLRAVELDIDQLIEDATRTLQPVLDSRKLELRWERTGEHSSLRIRADASRIKQVLLNLLENAADASPPGGTIEIATREVEGCRVAIQITDRGHGISAQNLDRIFEPFFTTREEGTGLGLAIVNKLVTAHEGEVRVDSSLGVGSTFTVVIPAESAELHAPPSGGAQHSRHGGAAEGSAMDTPLERRSA